jgi:hypothetical protein
MTSEQHDLKKLREQLGAAHERIASLTEESRRLQAIVDEVTTRLGKCNVPDRLPDPDTAGATRFLTPGERVKFMAMQYVSQLKVLQEQGLRIRALEEQAKPVGALVGLDGRPLA